MKVLPCLNHFERLAYEDFSAVEAAIENSNILDKAGAYQTYLSAASGKSNSAARSIAVDILGEQVYWDWDGNALLHLLIRHLFILHSPPH